MSGMVSPVRSAAWLRPGDTGCAARSPPAVRRVAVADELIVCFCGALVPWREPFSSSGSDAGEAGSGGRGTRKTSPLDRLAGPSPAAHKTWTRQEDGFRTALLTRPGWVRSATS
jgi:hypothetical protein